MKTVISVEKALQVLRSATTPYGILALADEAENYRRIWSRDASIAGIAGMLAGDEVLIKGLKSSLLTLAAAQAETGAIPSNVIPESGKASYGSLAGRVDATTWWLIASAVYYRHSRDEKFLSAIREGTLNAFRILRSWEFNERHLLYTPLSGNWADEYPLHGYLLYDNCLRLWALRAWASILESEELYEKSKCVEAAIKNNFWVDESSTDIYHPKLQINREQSFWLAGFHPGGPYEGIFDAAGNALACLLDLGNADKVHKIYNYINRISAGLGQSLVPAFWPVIQPGERLWDDIANNYAYHFKNAPHHFHNGGCWPVMQGWMLLALQLNDESLPLDVYRQNMLSYLENKDFPFPEYIDTLQFRPGGKSNLSFSAAGCILMAVQENSVIKEKLCLV